MSAFNMKKNTENMDVIYIWIHCNLVYVRWIHEIFVLMKY